MATPTYVALGTITLASATSSLVFSSIPATYRDLILILRGSTGTTALTGVRLNADTGSNYSWVLMRGNGSNAASASGTETYVPIWYAGNPQSGVGIVQIMDYSATDKHKTALVRQDTDNDVTAAFATRWANTAAVTSLTVRTSTSSFNIGTTISIYGVN